MEQYVVEGGNPLVGEVEIGGAKNAALAILAASVMTDETVLIENMPDVRDTNILLQAMQSIGVIVDRVDPHTVKVNASHIHDLVIEDDFIKKIGLPIIFWERFWGNTIKRRLRFPAAATSEAVRLTSISKALRLWAPMCASSTDLLLQKRRI